MHWNQPCDVIPVTPAHPQPRHQLPTPHPPAVLARTSKTRHRPCRTQRVPTQPRSGMTRNGRAYGPATSARRTAATGSSSSPGSPPPFPASSPLPTPTAVGFNDTESLQSWQARRGRQKQLGRNGNGMGMPLSIVVRLLPTPTAVTTWRTPAEHMAWRHDNGRTQPCDLQVAVVLQVAPLDPGEPGGAAPGQAGGPAGRLLPTPDTGTSPAGHGRRGGRPGNGHQSGHDLDAVARALHPLLAAAGTRPPAGPGRHAAGQTGSRPGRVTRAWTGDRMRRRSAAGSMPSAAPRLPRPSGCRASGCGWPPRSPSG